MENFDIAVIGAGLAGLVAATEAADRGRRVVVLEQEGRQSLGGQAFWAASRLISARAFSWETARGFPAFAAGEAAGFGGGGLHGYRALEGSFLGGCLFSGRIAGRAAAETT